MKKRIFIAIIAFFGLASCTENYSTGERIGMVTQFSQTGMIWTTDEGQLNMTQTGMNSSGAAPFGFSLDRKDKKGVNSVVRKQIKQAAEYGWKVKLIYHEVKLRNWFSHRGETNHFIDSVVILDKDPMSSMFENKTPTYSGKSIDTIFVVIDKSQLK